MLINEVWDKLDLSLESVFSCCLILYQMSLVLILHSSCSWIKLKLKSEAGQFVWSDQMIPRHQTAGDVWSESCQVPTWHKWETCSNSTRQLLQQSLKSIWKSSRVKSCSCRELQPQKSQEEGCCPLGRRGACVVPSVARRRGEEAVSRLNPARRRRHSFPLTFSPSVGAAVE